MNMRRHETKRADIDELLSAVDVFVGEYGLQVNLKSF